MFFSCQSCGVVATAVGLLVAMLCGLIILCQQRRVNPSKRWTAGEQLQDALAGGGAPTVDGTPDNSFTIA